MKNERLDMEVEDGYSGDNEPTIELVTKSRGNLGINCGPGPDGCKPDCAPCNPNCIPHCAPFCRPYFGPPSPPPQPPN